MTSVDDLEELHVGSLGKSGMCLEVRAQLDAARESDRLVEHHAVRVADRDEHRLDAAGARVEMHAVGLTFEVGRQVGSSERGAADVELARDLGTLPLEHADGVGAADRVQVEPIARAVLEDRVGGGDTEPVAALLSL